MRQGDLADPLGRHLGKCLPRRQQARLDASDAAYALQDRVAVCGIELDAIAAAARALGGDQCRARPGEHIKHDAATLRAIEYGVRNQCDRLDGRVLVWPRAGGIKLGDEALHFDPKQADGGKAEDAKQDGQSDPATANKSSEPKKQLCSNLPDPAWQGEGRPPLYDGEKVFALSVPTQLELQSAHFRFPETLTELLKLDQKLSERMQLIRDLSQRRGVSDTRRLFILSSIANRSTTDGR